MIFSKAFDDIERFWKLPEGTKVASLAFLISGIVGFMYWSEKRDHAKDNVVYEKKLDAKNDTLMVREARHYQEQSDNQRKCDSTAAAKMEAELGAYRRLLRDARVDVHGLMQDQNKTLNALKKAAK